MKCRYCGCTDENACEGGCCWVAPRVCSRCAHQQLLKLGVHQGEGVYVPHDLLKLMVTALAGTYTLLCTEAGGDAPELWARDLWACVQRDTLLAAKAYGLCEQGRLVPPVNDLVPQAMVAGQTNEPQPPRLWRPGDV